MHTEQDTDSCGVVVYDTKEVQQIFKCGRKKAYELMNNDAFPSFRIGGSLYVERDALQKWLDRQKGKK